MKPWEHPNFYFIFHSSHQPIGQCYQNFVWVVSLGSLSHMQIICGCVHTDTTRKVLYQFSRYFSIQPSLQLKLSTITLFSEYTKSHCDRVITGKGEEKSGKQWETIGNISLYNMSIIRLFKRCH